MARLHTVPPDVRIADDRHDAIDRGDLLVPERPTDSPRTVSAMFLVRMVCV
ncbi:hypothetical protein [Streptosporangium saharense]|uniref:hypothetical protein n=1 Tax=Streptosporangium saharense TaxID=1706840 RepID=UPI0036C15D38